MLAHQGQEDARAVKVVTWHVARGKKSHRSKKEHDVWFAVQRPCVRTKQVLPSLEWAATCCAARGCDDSARS